MMDDFPDYNRAPGFWMMMGFLFAADISENPEFSAGGKMAIIDNNDDIYDTLDYGLTVYERNVKKYTKYRGW